MPKTAITTTTLDLTRRQDADPGLPLPADDLPLTSAEEAQVEQAVRTIRALLLAKRLEVAIGIHRYVLDEFFDGNWERYAVWGGQKSRAFEALRRHRDLGVGRESLQEWMKVGEQIRQLPPEVAHQLTVEHHRALLSLEDSAAKAQMAREAVAQDWTAKDLAAQVRTVVPTSSKPRRGRPAQPKAYKKLGEAYSQTKSIDRSQLAQEASGWTASQRKYAKERAQALRELAEAMLAALA